MVRCSKMKILLSFDTAAKVQLKLEPLFEKNLPYVNDKHSATRYDIRVMRFTLLTIDKRAFGSSKWPIPLPIP